MDLKEIYLTTLDRCSPEVLVRRCVDASLPRSVVAIGKCAGALLDGIAGAMAIEDAFVALPRGYPLPRTKAEVHAGGHPHMTHASFEAGRALLRFVSAHDDLLFLVSGGGSACVEVALRSEEETAAANDRLIASGLPIRAINAERRKYSGIKGGKLRELVRGRCVTLVYSDVQDGALEDVASGPTIVSSDEAILIADNGSLRNVAAKLIGAQAVVHPDQIECDVEEAAQLLADRAAALSPGEILVAGGEPTVVVRGAGVGGRCSELALRFAAKSNCRALFGSSDGVDGNTGAAGISLPPRTAQADERGWYAVFNNSDTYRIASQLGEPIMIAPTGNNLRDLYLVARD
jgi:glycerate-2-kinase